MYLSSACTCGCNLGFFLTKFQKGLYLHEIGHAIGLIHEQNRPDRDEFIRINVQNIQPGLQSQFEKYPESYINTRNVQYDFPSVMHYGVTVSFTIDIRKFIFNCYKSITT